MQRVYTDEDLDLGRLDWLDEEESVDEEHGDLYEQLYGESPIDRSIMDFYDPEAEAEHGLPHS